MNMNPETVAEQDWVEATPSGATDLTTIEITDTVAAINRNQRTITFNGTGGKTRTIKVDPSVQGFNQVEVGDMVVLEVTRAVAVERQARLIRDALSWSGTPCDARRSVGRHRSSLWHGNIPSPPRRMSSARCTRRSAAR